MGYNYLVGRENDRKVKDFVVPEFDNDADLYEFCCGSLYRFVIDVLGGIILDYSASKIGDSLLALAKDFVRFYCGNYDEYDNLFRNVINCKKLLNCKKVAMLLAALEELV